MLAALGPHQIGVRRGEVVSQDVVTLTKAGLTRAPRTIKFRIWYPAKTTPDATRASFTHVLPRPDGKGAPFTIPSLAVENAQAAGGTRYPLVIVSHGYNGWDSFMTWLTENLATKGYIVVAIDHADQRAISAPEFGISFGNVLINRAADQRAVINHLTIQAADRKDSLGQMIDANNIGVIGYSMGGFGALATAGIDYDAASGVFKQLPAEAQAAIFDSQTNGKLVADKVKAIVALAPFGGRPESRAWTANALAQSQKPILIIGGSDDDIVDMKSGISWIFEQLTATSRHMLIFLHARHNVGGNPPPLEANDDFSTREYFAEPVWRPERINAINQHFITAFLDLHLKADAAKSAFLNVPTARSGDGAWPLAPLENVGGKTATEKESGYWPGFQRRWALGLEMRDGRSDQPR
ncbi:MAG: dienelactone hydrolase family protein [Sphingopyxis sp.]|nr:dienelactone hydrolase family protein [Sphingopyxis sp.]